MSGVKGNLPEINKDFSEKFREISIILERAIQLNFTMGGRPPSNVHFPNIRGVIPWEPLKPPRSGTPLVATGRFYASISTEYDKKSARVFIPDGVFPDSRVPFVHQMGTESAGRNHNVRIPARPYMMLTDFDIEKIKEVLMDDIIIRTNI